VIPELLRKIGKKKFHVVDLLFWLVIALIVCMWGFWNAAYGQAASDKKWQQSEVQYQISEECSRFVGTYVRQAVREFSKHTVKLSTGSDDIYVSCEYPSPFDNNIQYLPDGVSSEDESFVLGTTRTTWYTRSGEIISAHVWIDPIFAPIFNLKGVVFHEFGHAMGEPHTFGGIMQSNAQGEYLDAHTIARLRDRYNKPASAVIDSEGDYYLPCLWVPSVISRLVGEREGYYFTQTKGGEIVDFGKSECN
tara:strand:+ start:2130 stop:2876 length:747 start_codon:yes stop_codon:yes gene_type:complete